MSATKTIKRKKYPKCRHYRDGKHRFGISHLSFQEVCMYRHDGPDDICKCGFSRKKHREAKRELP